MTKEVGKYATIQLLQPQDIQLEKLLGPPIFPSFTFTCTYTPDIVRNLPYVEPFRRLNRDEEQCVVSSVIRGRIPTSDPLNPISSSIGVAYEYTSRGFTQCIILCESGSGTYLYLGTSKLNPEDRIDNKKKAQMIAFHRAVNQKG